MKYTTAAQRGSQFITGEKHNNVKELGWWAAWGSGSEKRKKNNQGYTLGSRSMLWFASPIVADSEVIVFQQEQPETADGAAAEPV